MGPPSDWGIFCCQLELQGKGLKYVSDRAKNAFELQTAPCNNCPVMPADWVQVTRDGHSVTSVDMVGGECSVAGYETR